MKRLLVLLIVWTLLVVTGTLVSADGQTRNRKSKFGRNTQTQPVLNSTRGTRVASVIKDVTKL